MIIFESSNSDIYHEERIDKEGISDISVDPI